MKRFSIILSVFMLLFASSSYAIDNVPKDEGFSGYIHLLGGWMNAETNMYRSIAGQKISNKKIDRLTDAEDRNLGIANAAFELGFTNESTYFFVSSLEKEYKDLMDPDLAYQIGIRQDFNKIGIIQASGIYDSLIKTYENPYLTNNERKVTRRTVSGATFIWGNIFDTDLEIAYVYKNYDLGKEESNFDSLDREGNRHMIRAAYNFNFGAHSFVPAFRYTRDDRDGKAMSGNSYDGEISYFFCAPKTTINISASYGHEDYDETNPLFMKERDDDHFTASASMQYAIAKGTQYLHGSTLSLYANVSYKENNSNIDFYDEKYTSALAGISLNW